MSNQCCSIRIISLFVCLITNYINIDAQPTTITTQPQFGSSGFVNTFNGGLNNARSINAGLFLQSNVQTNKDQGQELPTLDDGSKNEPTEPVVSFVIPKYANGITHLLDMNGKLPKIPNPSDELEPPFNLKPAIDNDNEINSTDLLPKELSLPSETYTEATTTPITIGSMEQLTEANFNSLFQTLSLATTPTIESTTSAMQTIFFTTKSSESQNTTKNSQQNLASTDKLRETTTFSPETWRRLIILGEQRTPGYAVRSDGSIDPNIDFTYATALPTITVPSFGFENGPITTATPILLPVLEMGATTSSPPTTLVDLIGNPFLPPLSVRSNTQNGMYNKKSNEINKPRVNNLFQMTHSSLFGNNLFSTSTNKPLKYTNPSNSFAASKFTMNGFQKSTSSSSIVQNEPTHAPSIARTTNSRSIFTTAKTTSDTFLERKPNASTLNGFAKKFASNMSVTQQPKVRNGFEPLQNKPVPNNNPFLPPLPPLIGKTMPNLHSRIFTFKNQVNIRNGININENPIQLNNQENGQATDLSTVNDLAPSTVIDSFSSTSNPFAAFKFTVSGFLESATSSSIVQNQPTHAPSISQTTNSESILTATEISTETSDSVPPVYFIEPNALSRLATDLASNVSVPVPTKAQNGVEVNNNIPVPDNNPFLPPLERIMGTTMPNFAFKHQVNNSENIQTTNSSSVNHRALSTEKSIIDSYPSTSKSFIAFNFRSSHDSSNNQTFDNPITTQTDRISDSIGMTTTETPNPTLIEKSTIQPTYRTPSTFEPVTNSIMELPANDLLPPIYLNNDLLPPLRSESSICCISVIKNDTTNSSLEISNNPFLPTLDLNPLLAPFSSDFVQTLPQEMSKIPSIDFSTTTKPNLQSNFRTRFDNMALRKNFFPTPITQAKNFKYTGGFGAPPGILSPYDKSFNK